MKFKLEGKCYMRTGGLTNGQTMFNKAETVYIPPIGTGIVQDDEFAELLSLPV
jgi:hypothetical protein